MHEKWILELESFIPAIDIEEFLFGVLQYITAARSIDALSLSPAVSVAVCVDAVSSAVSVDSLLSANPVRLNMMRIIRII